jgi:hypothetical protein
MTTLVSDTSVLIDLERGELIECAFELSATFVVPDVLYERELREYGGDGLLKLGVKVESLDGCHGVLWLLDEFEIQGAATHLQLHAGLERISNHPRCRLPKQEIASRLSRYMSHF